MAQFIKVATTADLAPGEAKCVEVAGKKLALFNLEGNFYAIDDTCTHRGGPLSEGEVSGEEVTCPWHGAIYNIKTGAVLGPPAPSLDGARWRRRDRSSEPKPIPRFAPCVPTAARAYRPKWAIPTRSMRK